MHASSSSALDSREQILHRIRRKIISVVARRGRSWKELFLECDKNRDGHLDLSEVKNLFRGSLCIASQAVNDHEMQLLFSTIDKDMSGMIDAAELFEYIEHGERRPEDVVAHREKRLARVKKNLRLALRDISSSEMFVRQMFKKLDMDGSMRISHYEFKYWVRSDLNLSRWDIADDDLLDFFLCIDFNGDGTIEVAELFNFIRMYDREKKSAGGVNSYIRAAGGLDKERPASASSLASSNSAVSHYVPRSKRKTRTFRQKLSDSPMHRASSLPNLGRATAAFTNMGRLKAPTTRIGATMAADFRVTNQQQKH